MASGLKADIGSGPDEGLMRLLRDAQLAEDFIDEVTWPNGSPYQWKTCSELFWSISKADPHSSVEKILNATPYTQSNPSLAPMIACRLLMVYEAIAKAKDDAAEIKPDAADDVDGLTFHLSSTLLW